MPDTTVVDIHRLSSPEAVRSVEGGAWRVNEDQPVSVIEPGTELAAGDTIALEAGACVRLESMELTGGPRGRAHSFVAPDAFKSSPSREDVPRLLEELEQLEKQIVEQTGEDPLALQRGPDTPFERAMSRDFAFSNLVLDDARELPPALAKREGAVALFTSGDGAHVAVVTISLAKLRTLMRALGRPVTPHMIEEDTLRALSELVYGPERPAPYC